jgi:hypothetical protein
VIKPQPKALKTNPIYRDLIHSKGFGGIDAFNKIAFRKITGQEKSNLFDHMTLISVKYPKLSKYQFVKTLLNCFQEVFRHQRDFLSALT